MKLWHPDAIRVPGRSAGPHAPSAGAKILHHTTEGSSAAGAFGAFRATGSWPTFTLEWTGGRLRIYQHMPLNEAARALAHPSGPETNRANVVQLEHVGFAANTEDWSAERYAAIGTFCRWVEAQTGCPSATVPGTKWGEDHPPRLSGEAFFHGMGHCGHQHCPGNDHWDPGQLRIDAVVHVSDAPRRSLRLRDEGPDVLALQQAVRLRAQRCGRPDRMPVADGFYGAESKRDALFVAYVLGIGSSQEAMARKPLHEETQRRIRNPDARNPIQKTRAVGRRRRHCKGGKS